MIRTPKPICRHPLENMVTVTLSAFNWMHLKPLSLRFLCVLVLYTSTSITFHLAISLFASRINVYCWILRRWLFRSYSLERTWVGLVTENLQRYNVCTFIYRLFLLVAGAQKVCYTKAGLLCGFSTWHLYFLAYLLFL